MTHTWFSWHSWIRSIKGFTLSLAKFHCTTGDGTPWMELYCRMISILSPCQQMQVSQVTGLWETHITSVEAKASESLISVIMLHSKEWRQFWVTSALSRCFEAYEELPHPLVLVHFHLAFSTKCYLPSLFVEITGSRTDDSEMRPIRGLLLLWLRCWFFSAQDYPCGFLFPSPSKPPTLLSSSL